MSGSLAQIVALAAYGNAWLRTDGDPPELYPGHSAFQHVRKLEFARPRTWGPFHSQGRWTSTGAWYADLRRRGVRAFRLVPWAGQHPDLPDHIAVAFAGGAPCALAVVCERAEEWWAAGWRHEQGAWSVAYHCEAAPYASGASWPLETADRQLQDALREAIGFAEQARQGLWVDWFASALALREAPDPTIPYYPDLLPERGYSIEAKRTLACASQAWVFAGMGSWNDLGFADAEEQAEYDRITPKLFKAVLAATAAAASYGMS